MTNEKKSDSHALNNDFNNDQTIYNLNILLVEDNTINQKLALAYLKKLGLDADIAQDGIEAIQLLEAVNYDMVFMDIQMPLMDGLEATKIIRSPKSKVLNHDIPIIAMTAHAMPGDREKFINAGMNDYIPKPIKKDNLYEMIKKISGQSYKDLKSKTNQIPQNDNTNVFNLNNALFQMGGDSDLLQEVIDVYLTDTPKYINAVKSALKNNDHESLERNAHTIKSTSGLLNAKNLEKIAFKIEKAGKSKDFDRAKSFLKSLIDEFELVKKMMEELT